MPLVAEVTQAGDIVLFAFVLGLTLVVGLALLGIDTLVGRARGKGGDLEQPPSTPPVSG